MTSNITMITVENEEQLELERILRQGSITTLYQPIISLTSGSIMGYEALSRGPVGSLLYSPDRLFDSASAYGRLHELEALCRNKALENASTLSRNKNLFINVDPVTLTAKSFKVTLTEDYLKNTNLNPGRIIFELTERNSIEDYDKLTETIAFLASKGYRIALDNAGSGYSGLKMLSKTRPHFLKLDMDMIRGIDSDLYNQSILGCLVNLSKVTNMMIIAEGIETEEELRCVIGLGADYGQGYLLHRPEKGFAEISSDIKEFIINSRMLRH